MAAVLSPLLFGEGSAPDPKPVEPVPPPQTEGSLTDDAATDEEVARSRRRALERLRRGRDGTIATSARGILAPTAGTADRRSLLGG